MDVQVGKQSLQFAEAPYILSSASIVGKKEGEGPLGHCFDVVGEDDKFGQNTWEEAESTLQKEAFSMAVGKAKLKKEDIRYLFSGDLLGQDIATSFGLMDYQVPLFGLYGACSTCGEALSLGAMCVAAGYADYVVSMTSSHFASAEKQFRFPLEYANQRPLSATWTVTGSGAFVLGKRKSKVRITGITTGKIMDYGVKDSMNMGAAMAPAAADTICQHLFDFGRTAADYDRIITGDLGT
ncbi:MAG: stage V sporulation protein AD, partial [Roseburia sp.]